MVLRFLRIVALRSNLETFMPTLLHSACRPIRVPCWWVVTSAGSFNGRETTSTCGVGHSNGHSPSPGKQTHWQNGLAQNGAWSSPSLAQLKHWKKRRSHNPGWPQAHGQPLPGLLRWQGLSYTGSFSSHARKSAIAAADHSPFPPGASCRRWMLQIQIGITNSNLNL